MLPTLEIPSFHTNNSNTASNNNATSAHPSAHGPNYSHTHNNQASYDPRTFHQSGQRVTTRSQYHHARTPDSHHPDHSNNNPNSSNPSMYAQSSISPLVDPQLASSPLNSSQPNLEPSPRRGTFGTFGPPMAATPGALPPISSIRHHRYGSVQSPNTSVGPDTNTAAATGIAAGGNVGASTGAPPPPVHPPPTHAFRAERDSTSAMVRRAISGRGGGLPPESRSAYHHNNNDNNSYHGAHNHHHHNQHSNHHNNTHHNNDGSMAIRNITPVKEALALLKDPNPIMLALTQTVLQSGTTPQSPSDQRNTILNFKGFPDDVPLRAQYLVALSKSDLEILAWIFVVPKHGKKEELATRIIQSLRAPLTYRVPAVGRRPHIPSRIEARPGITNSSAPAAMTRGAAAAARNAAASMVGATSTTNTTAAVGARTRAQQQQQFNPINSANITSNGNVSRRDSVLQSLGRQLEAESAAVRASTSKISLPIPAPVSRGAGVGGNGINVPGGRIKITPLQTSCTDRLKTYDFRQGENPFNEPLEDPLGEEKFVYFSSAQLSRGNDDPVLRFHTPAPITEREDPHVAGGAVQVHLRCLRVEVERPPRDWKQAWPFPASCRVNGHAVQLNQAQRYTNGKLAGRDAATNITGYLRKYSASSMNGGGMSASLNKVLLRRQISSATPTAGQYVLFAQQVLVHGHETMLKNVERLSEKYWTDYRRDKESRGELQAGQSDFEMAKQGVKKFLDGSDGITLSSMKVSLRCPLALIRMEIPVKGRLCHHVQCFDLGSFLEYSRRSCKFECPVCNKPTCHPTNLVKSPYIEHALKMFPDCDDVEIVKDGSLVAVERQQTGIASDDEDGDQSGSGGGRPRAGGSNAAPAAGDSGTGSGHGNSGPTARVAEIVDLTLDDSDEETVGGNAGTNGGSGIVSNLTANGQNSDIPGFSDMSRARNVRSVSSSLLLGTAQYGHDQQQVQQQPQQPQQQSNEEGLDHDDIDFTFHADFAPWGEHPQGQPQPAQQAEQTTHTSGANTSGGVRPPPPTNRPGWTVDVIAIDSDSD